MLLQPRQRKPRTNFLTFINNKKNKLSPSRFHIFLGRQFPNVLTLLTSDYLHLGGILTFHPGTSVQFSEMFRLVNGLQYHLGQGIHMSRKKGLAVPGGYEYEGFWNSRAGFIPQVKKNK